MFDKFLCKHIHKNEIRLSDVFECVYRICESIFVGFILLIVYIFFPVLIFSGFGVLYNDIIGTHANFENVWDWISIGYVCDGVLFIVCIILIMMAILGIMMGIDWIFNIKIAHCTKRDTPTNNYRGRLKSRIEKRK